MAKQILSFSEVVAALATSDKAASGKLAATVEPFKAQVALDGLDRASVTFRLIYMAAHSGKDAATVQGWLDDGEIKKREGSTAMHKAYGAARTALTRVKTAAGLAKAANKVTRKPAAPVAETAPEAPAPILPATFVAAPCGDLASVMAQADAFAVALAKLQKTNAKVITGDAGSLLRDAIAAFVKTVGEAHKVAAQAEPAKAEPEAIAA